MHIPCYFHIFHDTKIHGPLYLPGTSRNTVLLLWYKNHCINMVCIKLLVSSFDIFTVPPQQNMWMTQVGTAMQWNAMSYWMFQSLSLNIVLYGHDNIKTNVFNFSTDALFIKCMSTKQHMNNMKTLHKNRQWQGLPTWSHTPTSHNVSVRMFKTCYILTLSQAIHWLTALSRTRSPVLLRHCEFALRSPLDPILAVEPDGWV